MRHLEPAVDRAAVFAALGEPMRLAIVDRIVAGDLAPSDLAADLHVGTNLLAHHVQVLEKAGVIRRLQSEGDRRRSYITLRDDNPVVWAAAMSGRMPGGICPTASRVLFVCTANSARSQLAAARWTQVSRIPAVSAGTHPGRRVHPRAIRAGRRHGLHLVDTQPAPVPELMPGDDLVVVVCDNAHEELGPQLPRLHWSIPDPVRIGTDDAFDAAVTEIDRRLQRLAALTAS